jgi:hypothetical protein
MSNNSEQKVVSFADLRNSSSNQFSDISSEAWREYVYLTTDGAMVDRITAPVALHVSQSGGHRLLDASGICRYIAPGWHSIRWLPKGEEPHFVK